ncbi:copper resistance CopC family protein [Gaopeijia maritima]|uniref:Copper resistance CopC family protein n=1 Tax=Gaopeijia maritima TaxID=3119007 RepID=A0ABU9E7Y0_9BACT
MVRSLFAVAVAVTALVSLDSDGQADDLRHLRLERAEPAVDTVVTTAPEELRLFYSEEPHLATTTVRMMAEDETAIELAAPAADAENKQLIRVGVEGDMAPGLYTVAWRTTSADGHVVRGDYRFTVREASGADGSR